MHVIDEVLVPELKPEKPKAKVEGVPSGISKVVIGPVPDKKKVRVLQGAGRVAGWGGGHSACCWHWRWGHWAPPSPRTALHGVTIDALPHPLPAADQHPDHQAGRA